MKKVFIRWEVGVHSCADLRQFAENKILSDNCFSIVYENGFCIIHSGVSLFNTSDIRWRLWR
jgi:hypothetical protein